MNNDEALILKTIHWMRDLSATIASAHGDPAVIQLFPPGLIAIMIRNDLHIKYEPLKAEPLESPLYAKHVFSSPKGMFPSISGDT